MIESTPPRPLAKRDALLVALIVVSVLASLLAVTTAVFYLDWARVGPCNGGPGISSGCPPYIGFGIEEWEKGVVINESYLYRFVLFPVDAFQVNATALSISVQTTTEASVVLASVGIYSLQGLLLAQFHLSESTWTSDDSSEINLPTVLQLTATSNLAGDSLEIADPSANFAGGVGIT